MDELGQVLLQHAGVVSGCVNEIEQSVQRMHKMNLNLQRQMILVSIDSEVASKFNEWWVNAGLLNRWFKRKKVYEQIKQEVKEKHGRQLGEIDALIRRSEK